MPGMEENPTAKEAWFCSPKKQNKNSLMLSSIWMVQAFSSNYFYSLRLT
jgi:hypothetical protein